MRIAKEYIEEITISVANLGHIVTTGKINGSLLIDLEKTINIARKEAIEESAKRAKATMVRQPFVGMLPEVDKQSILSLIDELK